MQKKIFMPKSSQAQNGTSRSILYKWLFLAAVGLVLLVVITPMITRQKGGAKDALRKAGEKGTLVKEIPRAPDLMQNDKPPEAAALNEGMPTRDLQATPGESIPGGQAAEVSGASPAGSLPYQEPASGKPAGDKAEETASSGSAKTAKSQGWVDISQPQPPQLPQPQSKPSSVVGIVPSEPSHKPAAKENGGAVPTPSRPSDGMPGDKGNKLGPVGRGVESGAVAAGSVGKGGMPKGTQVASVESPAAAKVFSKNVPTDGAQPSASKTPPSGETAKPAATGAGGYTVQVGSFKDKQNAEEMQKNLQKKGYAVSVRMISHSKLGQLYVVQLQPVDNVGRASTLVEQIKHEEKVKPIIVRAGQGE